MDCKLSLSELPTDNHKTFVVVNVATGDELIINGGVTFKVIDNTGIHNFGWHLSADYFFELITMSNDDPESGSSFFKETNPSFGKGDYYSLEEIKKRREIGWEKLMQSLGINKK